LNEAGVIDSQPRLRSRNHLTVEINDWFGHSNLIEHGEEPLHPIRPTLRARKRSWGKACQINRTAHLRLHRGSSRWSGRSVAKQANVLSHRSSAPPGPAAVGANQPVRCPIRNMASRKLTPQGAHQPA
jgi:hypothetical protein